MLQGKTVFITGAARGIGAESARRLASKGANVVVAGLEPAELERVAAACGPNALAVEVDVTDRAALDDAVARTVERFGGLDIVFANAGIGSGGLLHSVDEAAFERTIEVNLLGVWRTVRACLPQIMQRRGYVLVNASIAAITPQFPVMGSYATAKAGAEAFASALRCEQKPHGVDVGVAYFSWIATDLVNGADAEHPAFKRLRDSLGPPLNKTYPVSVAADAVVRGMTKRSRNVCGPRWVRPLLPLRGLLARPTELQFASIMPEVEQLMDEEVRVKGDEAFVPVGAGGRADAQARRTGIAT